MKRPSEVNAAPASKAHKVCGTLEWGITELHFGSLNTDLFFISPSSYYTIPWCQWAVEKDQYSYTIPRVIKIEKKYYYISRNVILKNDCSPSHICGEREQYSFFPMFTWCGHTKRMHGKKVHLMLPVLVDFFQRRLINSCLDFMKSTINGC